MAVARDGEYWTLGSSEAKGDGPVMNGNLLDSRLVGVLGAYVGVDGVSLGLISG